MISTEERHERAALYWKHQAFKNAVNYPRSVITPTHEGQYVMRYRRWWGE